MENERVQTPTVKDVCVARKFKDYLDDIFELNEEIEARAEKLKEKLVVDPYESDKVDKLTAALAIAAGKFKPLKYNRLSSWFQAEYIDLDCIMEMLRPILSENELAITFFTKITDATILHTRLRHSSGQWIETRARLVANRDDLKTQESALNHLKRQQVMALINITMQGDVMDDDGVENRREFVQEMVKGVPVGKTPPLEHSNTTINQGDVEYFEHVLEDYPDILQEILTSYRIQHLADMPKAKMDFARKQVERLIRARKPNS